MNIVSIILARSGSKGIPKKNIMNFCGAPLLSWTIMQSLKAEKVSDVWVSSDSEEILNIAEEYGAKVIVRPKIISGDKDSSESAWLHALDYIEEKHNPIDYILAPQVTSPLRECSDFSKAIVKIIHEQSDSLLSVAEVEDFFVWEIDNANHPKAVNYDYNNRKPRQYIKKKYLENGSFYIFKPILLRKNNNRLGGKISIYQMEKHKMFQIDDLEDLRLCEVVMKGYGYS